MVDETADYPDNPTLKALKEQYTLGDLKLITTDGMRWRNRMGASDAYFAKYSPRWKTNKELYSDFDALAAKYGTYVAVPFAVVQNWINDTYYRNPDPLVQDKNGNKDLGRILSDVFRTIHHEVDSEQKMKQALMDSAWAGFGCLWVSFRQEGRLNPELYDFYRDQQGVIEPTKQAVTLTHISPDRVRFDPAGKNWDLSDHGYVGVLYEQSLAQVMRDNTVSDEDRRRIMAWYRAGAQNSESYNPLATMMTGSDATYKETDPEFIRLLFWNIWSRPDKKVYRQPLGSSFTLQPLPWNDEFAEADIFPLLYVAKNRDVDKFIGIPDLSLIEPQVKNINKLEALFIAANQHVINKYVTVKGALDEQARTKLADGVTQFAVIELDKDALNAFPTAMQEKMNLGDVLSLVPQAELKDLQHLEGIRQEMEIIQQIIGQGPADRGGVQQSGSATESLGMQQGLARRLSTARHENGKNFCRLTKLFFITLKARQTLPLRYQMTTAFNERVWQAFNADALADLDLHFEYAIGSTEYRTREQEFALRQQMAQVLMPVLQVQGNTRLMMKLAQDLIEPLNIIGAGQYFNDDASQIVMQLVAILRGLSNGQILADDPRAAQKIPELISALAQAMLTPQQLAEVEAASAGVQPPEPGGGASLPAAPTQGEQDFAAGAAGSAAAGAGGGMAN